LKKIVLLSDSHGYLDQAIENHLAWADEVWHAGDIGSTTVSDRIKALKPLRAVYGNIDGHQLREEFSENQIFECEGVHVLMTHIGGYPKKYNARVRELIRKHRPQLYICGHSHILKVIYDKDLDLLHLNPGAVGRSGFHKIRTLLRFCLTAGKIENLEVVELGPRSSN
jgi:putative phosphoesterase